MIVPIIIIAIIVLILIFVIGIYNSLVTSMNQVRNSWSQIDVELQRRFDLIPNLVETVKGYIKHEDSVLSKITELRSAWGNAKSIKEKAQLDSELSSEIKSINLAVEQYPDLKASTNFVELQNELSNTESKISTARASYNNTVAIYNTKIEIFPNNIVASLLGFKQEELFKLENEEAKQNVKVQF